jgi:uncharacterized protein YraI
MEHIMTKALLIAASLICASVSAASARQCMVSDPTGTPLNIRNSPNGDVLGTINNGSFVTLIGQRRDSRGRMWAQVLMEGTRYDVWLFREYVSCR